MVIYISATNRGGRRIKSDFYITPPEVVSNFLGSHQLQQGNMLEPCAGNGSFIKAIRQAGYDNHITSIEIFEQQYNNLLQYDNNEVLITDFLEWEPNKKYKTIITNPPYSLAMEFLNKSFEIAEEGTEIIMLLRLAFLEGKKRYNFWQKHPVNKLYALSSRPSFTGKGTDATAYGFFVWDGSNKQDIKVI